MLTSIRNDCDRDAAKLIRALAREQRAWASRHGVEVDGADLTEDLDGNLFSPLRGALRAQLELQRPGLLGELEKPGEMAGLCSTAALVHNVFEHWHRRAAGPIEGALGDAPGQAALDLRFSATAATAARDGSNGHDTRSMADALLQTGSALTVVAASFLEPYSRVDNRPEAAGLESDESWRDLEACRHLALDLRSNPHRFRHLAVARLVALGQAWTREVGTRRFRLLYLWWDGGGAGAARIRAEIDRFRMRAGGELRFAALSWQELFRELCRAARDDSDPASHSAYLQYLHSRYFCGDPSE